MSVLTIRMLLFGLCVCVCGGEWSVFYFFIFDKESGDFKIAAMAHSLHLCATASWLLTRISQLHISADDPLLASFGASHVRNLHGSVFVRQSCHTTF